MAHKKGGGTTRNGRDSMLAASLFVNAARDCMLAKM